MIKGFLFLIGFVFCVDKININTADLEKLSDIPIEKNKIVLIVDYINNYGIDNIYDLYNIDELTSEDIDILKQYVKFEKKDSSTQSKNKDLSSYKVDQWLSRDEGLTGMYVDRIFNKKNINYMTYDDLSALPALSPIDVFAVLRQRQERGYIKGEFNLKNSRGLSYYGYKNLRDFISYGNENNKMWSVRFTAMASNSALTDGVDEEEIPIETYVEERPETMSKLFLTYNDCSNENANDKCLMEKIKIGALRYNYLGDLNDIYSKKAFISYEGLNYKFIFGNFNASFGQGVVFSSGDSYRPRMTGHGFSKRQNGITYDLTRSHQFVLSGIGFQYNLNNVVDASFFYSDGSLINNNKRDAIINEDGSFSSFITMKPRLSYGYTNNTLKVDPNVQDEVACLNSGSLYNWEPSSNNDGTGKCYKKYIYEDMINSVEERTIGSNIRLHSNNGYVGMTKYESMYDRVLDPQILKSVVGGSATDFDPDYNPADSDDDDWEDYSGDGNFALGYMSNSADPEIRAMYANEGESPIWNGAKSYRRIEGYEFLRVFGNISIQGEYGRMDISNHKNDPRAYVVNAYMQFDNLNFLVLFRDYDLHYDNPYQRSFSEYRRYKSTIFEDAYWLEDPIFYNLYSANPQPQAERGYYVESRYQFHEDLIAGIQWDVWTRKADEARYFRIVNKLEWRPLFNYRIYLRYKLQSRGSHDIAHPSPYFTKEARVRFKIRLSNFDFVEFFYSWNYTTFSPRPRLTGNSNALGGDMTQGDIGKPEGSLGFMFSHNFSKFANMKAGVVYADGFLWYIEDNDFKLFDTTDGIIHSWISLRFNPTNSFSVKIKMSNSSDYPSTTIVRGNLDDGSWVLNPYVGGQNTNWKVQISYAI